MKDFQSLEYGLNDVLSEFRVAQTKTHNTSKLLINPDLREIVDYIYSDAYKCLKGFKNEILDYLRDQEQEQE